MADLAPMDVAQFSLCMFIAYGCFCRLLITERKTPAFLRHALVAKFGAFILVGFSPWTWGIDATPVSVLACSAVALTTIAASSLWASFLKRGQHA